MKKLCAVLSFVILVGAIAFSQQPSKASGGEKLTNQDIIGMVSLGLSDEVVISKIGASSNTDFDTSLDGLKALKAAKVSDAVIKQMIQPKTVARAVSPAPVRSEATSGKPGPVGPSCVVCYVGLDGKWTGLALLHISGREDRGFPKKGFVIYRGTQSPVRISEHRPVFYLVSRVLPDEAGWQIEQLGIRGDHREIQISQETMNGGRTGISAKDIRDVRVARVNEVVFSVTPLVDLVDGEYILDLGKYGDYDFGIGK
jgi:hypothetical protein